MGTTKQRRALASKIVGLDVAAVDAMNKTTSGLISCVYLFSLGNVSDLRESMRIGEEHADDQIVCKFGRTEDLASRTKAHNRDYGKIEGANLQLVYRGDIDAVHNSEAETKIAHLMQELDAMFSYRKHTELIIISEKRLKYIKKHFDIITELYRGRIKEMVTRIKEKDHEMELLREQTKLVKQKVKTLLARQETKLAKQEAEIARLQLQLAQRT